MKKTNNKGFSLVELIVVIAIMAVLIAVLAPSYLRYVEKSRNSTDMQNAAAMVTAVQVYAIDSGISDPNNMLAANTEYVIRVEKDGIKNTVGKPIENALKNAGLMDSNGKCDIKLESKSRTTFYELKFKVLSDGNLQITYDPAWLGGDNGTT